jgi:hypothetical protein
MPISGPSSYLPTLDLFLSHWAGANNAVGGAAVVLEDGTTRDALSTLRDDLETARDVVTDAKADASLARTTLRSLQVTLQARLVEFNARVRGDLPGSRFAAVLPEAFSVGQNEAIVREALRTMSHLWGKILQLGSSTPPGVTQPYTLSEGLDRAAFDALRNELRDAYRAESAARVDLGLARRARNDVQDDIYPKLKSYRQKITGLAASYPALVATLPALTPPDGHTPEPVAVEAVWDAPAAKARVTWEESSEPTLARYEVRGDAGEEYETEDEVVLGTVLPGEPRELLTAFALGSPGLTCGYKVYVVLETGNERGSDPVYVTRPG